MKILQMPLSRSPSRDVLVWKENQAQTFSVKSAYQVAQRLREQSRIEHSGVVADQSIWRRLCRLNVPPKVRMFVWRACSNILPTRDNLHQQKINVESVLPTNRICCTSTLGMSFYKKCLGPLPRKSSEMS